VKIRYFRSGAIRKARRAEKRRQTKQEYKERVAKWHPKYVIWPRKIITDDSADHATVVFFETVWQKARIVNNVGIDSFDRTVWMRHREKDYFIKKLDGTLEAEEDFSNREDMAMSSGATQGPSSVSGAMSAGTTQGR